MKNSIILAAVLLTTLFSCRPTTPRVAPSNEQTVIDTLEMAYEDTLDLTIPGTVITVYEDRVTVESPNVNTVYTTELERLFLIRAESGVLEYLQVNGDVLFEERSGSNRKYRYRNNYEIEIQKGNTLNGIIADHRSMGITSKKLYKCNPFLHNRGLQVGDVIKLDCE